MIESAHLLEASPSSLNMVSFLDSSSVITSPQGCMDGKEGQALILHPSLHQCSDSQHVTEFRQRNLEDTDDRDISEGEGQIRKLEGNSWQKVQHLLFSCITCFVQCIGPV